MANIEISTFTRNNDGNTYVIKDANAIPKSGSNQISGSLIPATDNSIDVGSSTKNLKMLYTKGITIDGKTIDTDANGNMTYDSHIVDTIEEQGNEYIRYSNGLQVCFKRYIVSANTTTNITLPKPFIDTGYISVITDQNSSGPSCSIAYSSTTTTGFDIVSTNGSNLFVNVISIGRWK